MARMTQAAVAAVEAAKEATETAWAAACMAEEAREDKTAAFVGGF